MEKESAKKQSKDEKLTGVELYLKLLKEKGLNPGKEIKPPKGSVEIVFKK